MKHFRTFCAFSLFAICGLFNGQAQELHTDSNAVSIANESNSTTGWGGGAIKASDSSDPYQGTYAMRLTSTTGSTGRYTSYSFTAVVGDVYDISIWAKVGTQSDDPAFSAWSGLSGFGTTSITGTAWGEYTFTVTATSTTPSIRVYTGISSGSTGDIVYIDRVSILKQGQSDTQAPTSPTLISNAHTETTADLSWSGATDDTGITSYKIFKDGTLEATLGDVSNHQIAGLLAGTSYSFTVTASDAAGNESTASNAVSVTTDSSSGGGGSSVWSESGSTATYTGNVAIGTSSVPSGYKLAVDGHIRTREIRVDQDTWPDYVFKEGYDLLSLLEIQEYINQNGHLPNIPSAKEVETNGVELGELNKLLLEKIEELTLFAIQQQQMLQVQQQQLDELKNLVAAPR